MSDSLLRTVVTLCALVSAALGLILVFAPEETAPLVVAGARGTPLLQLLGAALLGFGVMNWTARGSALGGIYGRAIVAANQMHYTVGALSLLQHGAREGGTAAFWGIAAAYTAFAIFWLYLLFFRSGGRGQTGV